MKCIHLRSRFHNPGSLDESRTRISTEWRILGILRCFLSMCQTVVVESALKRARDCCSVGQAKPNPAGRHLCHSSLGGHVGPPHGHKWSSYSIDLRLMRPLPSDLLSSCARRPVIRLRRSNRQCPSAAQSSLVNVHPNRHYLHAVLHRSSHSPE
jgi:hypothetical protein